MINFDLRDSILESPRLRAAEPHLSYVGGELKHPHKMFDLLANDLTIRAGHAITLYGIGDLREPAPHLLELAHLQLFDEPGVVRIAEEHLPGHRRVECPLLEDAVDITEVVERPAGLAGRIAERMQRERFRESLLHIGL